MFHIRKLEKADDVSAFSCGKPSLDDYLIKYAWQNQKNRYGMTYVAVRGERPTVSGYYTISNGAVSFEACPPEIVAKMPRYPVPTIHMGRLAVNKREQGQRLGEQLLIDALARAIRISDEVAIRAMDLFALDDDAAAFYAKYDFVRLRDNTKHMLLPLATAREALGL